MQRHDAGRLNADSDRQIELAFRQRRDTLGPLYRAYAIRLYRFCRSRGLSEADAEDVCHDAMLKAFQSLHSFRFGEPIWPWLATIAANACTDFCRREAKSLTMAVVPDLQDDDTPELQVQRRESAQLVMTALSNIQPQYASILYLREFERCPYAEMSSILGLSLPAVRTRLLRARRMFRREVLRLLERSPAGLTTLVTCWLLILRRGVSRLGWKARGVAPHLAVFAFSIAVLSVPNGDLPTAPSSVPGVTASRVGPTDIRGPIVARVTEVANGDLHGSGQALRLSPTGSSIRTRRLNTQVPTIDPTDDSPVRIEVGPVEVWCPWLESAHIAERTCSTLSSVSTPAHDP